MHSRWLRIHAELRQKAIVDLGGESGSPQKWRDSARLDQQVAQDRAFDCMGLGWGRAVIWRIWWGSGPGAVHLITAGSQELTVPVDRCGGMRLTERT